jgi:hypothetical protein
LQGLERLEAELDFFFYSTKSVLARE